MSQPLFINYNGKLLRQGTPIVSADNRSFRYGDGCFETLKIKNSAIVLEAYHFERLLGAMKQLQFDIPKKFTPDFLKEQMLLLLKKNKHEQLGRVRLTVFRGDGGLFDVENNLPNYVIQSWKLNENQERLNENGLVTGIYKDARKVIDAFSNLKSNNFLCYVMAALWAKQQKLNDAIVLNTNNNIADATIANIFIVKDGVIKTPALEEGVVAGTMRRFLINKINEHSLSFEETRIKQEDILSANEVFFTNAVYGIKWVQRVDETVYSNDVSRLLYQQFVQALFE